MGDFTIEELNAAKLKVDANKNPKLAAKIDKLISEIDEPEWGDIWGNVIPSAKAAGKDAWEALTHPIDTASNMKDLLSGAWRQTSPMNKWMFEQFDKTGMTSPEDEQVADAAGGYLVDRISNPKKTLIEDPFGALLDIGSLATGGASLAPKGSMIANMGNKLAGFTDMPGQLTKLASKVAPSISPAEIYSSTVKFGTTIDKKKRDKMVKTALDEQIEPSQIGLDKLNDAIDESMDSVKGSINKATLEGVEIPKDDLLRSVKEYRDNIDPVTYGSDYKDVMKQIDDVIKNQEALWKDLDVLTPDQVQMLKGELDKKINFSKSAKTFGTNYKPGTEQAHMDIRTDAKHSLEQLDPNIGPENKRASDLISLRDDGLTQSSNRIDNRDKFGVGSMLKIGPGVAAGSAGGIAAGIAIDLLTRPKINAQRALWMHRQGQKIDKVKTKVGRLGDANLPEGFMSLVRKLPDAAKYLDENGRLTAAGRQLMIEVEKITSEGEESRIKGALAQ